MTTPKSILLLSFILLLSSLFLAACGPKTTSKTASQSPTPVPFQLKPEERPYISLIPRADGHQLTLKIDNIPTSITQMEYELLYTASDNGNDIEKGLGDTIKLTSQNISRDLLLGTASCTNGCKYKYDDGVNSGTISLTFITADGQSATYQSPFSLKSGADIIKDKRFSLDSLNFGIGAFPANKNEYFVLIQNYGFPKNIVTKGIYSIFASGDGKGKVTDTAPANISKDNPSIIAGDYLSN